MTRDRRFSAVRRIHVLAAEMEAAANAMLSARDVGQLGTHQGRFDAALSELLRELRYLTDKVRSDTKAAPGPRDIRCAAGLSQIHVAVQTGTSEPTVRLYEANPDAVTVPKKRTALDAFYQKLASEAPGAVKA